MDPQGRHVEFSIIVSSSNPERTETATLVQDDLKQLGIQVDVVPLEMRSILDRVTRTYDYEMAPAVHGHRRCRPQSGPEHVAFERRPAIWWHPSQKTPATAWEAEIDAPHAQAVSDPPV